MVQGVAVEDGCLVNTNPATSEVIERVKMSTSSDVDGAVDVALAVQQSWASKSLAERTALVKAAASARPRGIGPPARHRSAEAVASICERRAHKLMR